MQTDRRGVLRQLMACSGVPFVAAPVSSVALAASQTGGPRSFDLIRLRSDLTRATLWYRGVHFGTHRPVFYEAAWRVRETVLPAGKTWTGIWDEIHDGDVLEGPNRLPRSRREAQIDPRTGRILFERLKVIGKPIEWVFDQHEPGRVRGTMERYGPVQTFSGQTDGTCLSGDGINLLLASLTLSVGDRRPLKFMQPTNDGGIQTIDVDLVVERAQFMMIDEKEFPVLRVSLASATPFVGGTGTLLISADVPHIVLRAEYQSTHLNGPPVFDSRGADVFAGYRLEA